MNANFAIVGIYSSKILQQTKKNNDKTKTKKNISLNDHIVEIRHTESANES